MPGTNDNSANVILPDTWKHDATREELLSPHDESYGQNVTIGDIYVAMFRKGVELGYAEGAKDGRALAEAEKTIEWGVEYDRLIAGNVDPNDPRSHMRSVNQFGGSAEGERMARIWVGVVSEAAHPVLVSRTQAGEWKSA